MQALSAPTISGIVTIALVVGVAIGIAIVLLVQRKLRGNVTTYNSSTIKDMPANVRAGFLRSLESTRQELNSTIDSFEHMLGEDE